jgi:lysozyme family protein
MAILKTALLKTLGHEGGYSNNPKDPGGETNFGITKKTAVAWGYTGSMKDMTIDIACDIYRDLFWNKIQGDKIISQQVADELFDTGVNCGVSRSVMFMQKAYNKLVKGSPLDPDGDIGPTTIKAINDYPKPNRLEKAMNAEQCSYYCRLTESNEKFEDFYFGWLENRVAI